MEFAFSPEEEKFREEIREFLRSEPLNKYPCEDEDEGYGFGAWSVAFARRLGEKGWIGLTWPKEYGGQGRSVMGQLVLFHEMAYSKAPAEVMFYTETVGEAIVKGGTKELKGSKTENNLQAAFSGESGARNKYTFSAEVANKEGLEHIAEIFLETANNELAHARRVFGFLNGIGDTEANLKGAVEGEHYETTKM